MSFLQETLKKEVFIPAVEQNFPIYVQLLKEAANGFITKSGFTWVDLWVTDTFLTIYELDSKLFEKHVELHNYLKRIQSHPNIKNYIENRKKTKI